MEYQSKKRTGLYSKGTAYGKGQWFGKGQEKRASHEKPVSHHFCFSSTNKKE